MNYDELNKFTGSLTNNIRFFCHDPKGGGHGTMPPSLKQIRPYLSSNVAEQGEVCSTPSLFLTLCRQYV